MDLNKLVSELTIADKICLYNTLYEDLACKGIDGDTELAHVNKQEMAVLRAMGGSGTINPNTNLVQFGGGGSPPPPPPATSTVTQQATIPDELKPFITDILEKSRAIQERREEEGYVPFQGPRLSDFTEEQLAAFQGIQGLQGAGQPFYDRATALTEASAQAPTSESVNELMNPFMQNVIDVQTREALRQGDVETQNIGASAVQAGGFGGSRHAILEAEQARNLQQRLGDIQARGQAAAFEDAQARLQQQRERERQAGAQFMGLGSQVPGQRLREITGLEAVGAQKQALGQAGIDIAAQEFEIGRSFPERTLQDYQSIVRGYAQPIPASTLQRASSQQPAPSFLSQAAGLGAAGLGAFKAFGGNAQGGLVGLAEGGLPAGGTVLESQTEAISERAQNDPLTQVERQPLSQGQQFVRGQDNQEAATVEEQLKQIQGLALGATNAIAQGQQKLASMNTAPGMGAQPANFGGNVGSFGFKKGGLLGLKHLSNGGTVRLAAGATPGGSSDGTQKDIISRLSMDELIKASSNPNFSIKMVTDELMKRKADRTARSMSERRLRSRAERDSFPAISEEEVSNTLLTESYTPEQSILKQLASTVKPEDTQSFAQRQLKAKQPPAQSELTGKEITGPEAFKLRSENRPESPLQKRSRELATTDLNRVLLDDPARVPQVFKSLVSNPADFEKPGTPLTRDVADDMRQIQRSLPSVEQRNKMIRSLESETGRPYGFNIMPTEEGVLNRLSFVGNKIGQGMDYAFGERSKDRTERLQKLDKDYSSIDERQIPLIKELRRLKSLDRPEALADDAAISGESSELRPDRVSFDPSRVPTSPTVPLSQSTETTTKPTEEVMENTNIIGLDESTGPDDKSISESMEEGAEKAVATAAEHAKTDPKIVKEQQAAITNSGKSATEGLYANLNQFLDDRKAQTLANKTELDKLNAEQRKNLTDSAANRDKEEGLLYLEAGLSILAQPGGQTALQAIAKGAKDSNLIKGLSKLNAEQKQLAMNLNTLDRKALKDKMGFDDREAGLIMKGAELDIKARESEARMASATNSVALKRETAISSRIKEQIKALGIIGGDPSTKDGAEQFDKFYLSVVEDRSQNMPDNIRKTLLGDLDFELTNSETWMQTNLLDNPIAQAAFKKEFFGLRDKEGKWTGPIDMERKIQKAVHSAYKAAYQTYKQNEKK